jgi:predicted small lipoprotein YifL
MSRATQILVSALLLAVALVGCGQKGPLYLPTGEAAQGRATLPQTLNPGLLLPASPASAPPATGTASPVHTP